MTDMAVTSANVRAITSHGAVVVPGVAGGTLTVGYAVYQDSNGLWQHADANVSATVAAVTGIVVETFDGEDTVIANNACSVCVLGPVGGYDALDEGAFYYLSATVGRIADAFAGAGSFKKIVGYGINIAGFVCLWVNPVLTDAASS
jgi:hypothetical protein